MPASSKIATIVLNWNGEADSIACIEALRKQTIDHTIIAVDNGSTDNFVRRMKTEFSDITLLENKKNLGFDGGVNTGIRYALSRDFEFIALLNNDALPEKSWLQELFITAIADDINGIVTGKLLKTDGTIDSTGDQYTIWGLAYPRGRGELDSGQYDQVEEVFAASGGASLYRCDMLKKIGLFDEDFFAYYEDVDISFRAQLAGWKVMYAPKAVAYHKIGASSGKRKGFTTYQTIKNLPWLLWKNVPWKLMPIIWPRFFIAHTSFVFSALTRGEIVPVVKGLFMATVLFPKKLIERHRIQKNCQVSVEYISSMLVHDLPPNASKLKKLRTILRIKQ